MAATAPIMSVTARASLSADDLSVLDDVTSLIEMAGSVLRLVTDGMMTIQQPTADQIAALNAAERLNRIGLDQLATAHQDFLGRRAH